MSGMQDGAELLARAMRRAFKGTFEQEKLPKEEPVLPPVEGKSRG